MVWIGTRNCVVTSKYVIVASLTNMLSINMNIHTISIHSNNNRYVLMFWLLLFFQAGAGWISWEIMCAAANSLENANATTTTNKKATKKSNKTFLCCTPSCCFGGGPGPKATKDNNGAAKPRNSRWAIFANFTVCSLFFLRLSLIQSPTQDYLNLQYKKTRTTCLTHIIIYKSDIDIFLRYNLSIISFVFLMSTTF